MRSVLRSFALCAALALAGCAPAWAQSPPPAGSGDTPAPVCSGTGEDGAATCSSGDAAGGAPAPGTVGPGQVLTDPSGDVDGGADGEPASPPKRGELHVLGSAATRSSKPASSGRSRATAAAPRALYRGAVTRPSASPRASAARARMLPFTGVDARLLALAGASLLLAGLGLRRRAGAPA